MKRAPVLLVGLLFVSISLFHYRLIAASLTSFAAWCVLAAGHPGTLERSWVAALFEYWLAGLAWVGMAVWLVRSILRMRKRTKSPGTVVRTGANSSERWSQLVIGSFACVALMSPFLTPLDPNAQGNLLTTRLRPPLSTGYVREYLDRSSAGPGTTDPVSQVFHQARAYVLHRTVVVSGEPDVPADHARHEGILVREFRTVFVFGTDDNARDVFSRVIAGARVSLGVGISAALGALVIGMAVGFAAGMSRGIAGSLLMRLTDVFLAIPSLFLVIGAVAFVGQSIMTIVLVLALTGWMGITRVVKGEVVSLREREFILAAKLLRVSRWRMFSSHLLPNLRPVIVTATVLQFASAVLGEAALGFLGLGIRPPTATWGNMMGQAIGDLGAGWWVGIFPGIFLAAVIVSAHTMGTHSAAKRLAGSPVILDEVL